MATDYYSKYLPSGAAPAPMIPPVEEEEDDFYSKYLPGGISEIETQVQDPGIRMPMAPEGYVPSTTDYDQMIMDKARGAGVDPQLALSMASQESAFDPNAVSSKGAQGLFQLMPETYAEMGYDPAMINDPETNISAGMQYMGQQLKDFGGDVPSALSAYNAGPAATRSGAAAGYVETQDYKARIMEDTHNRKLYNQQLERDRLEAAGALPTHLAASTPDDPGHVRGAWIGTKKGYFEDLKFVADVADWFEIPRADALSDYINENWLEPATEQQAAYLAHGNPTGRVGLQFLTEGQVVGLAVSAAKSAGIAGLKGLSRLVQKGMKEAAPELAVRAAREGGEAAATQLAKKKQLLADSLTKEKDKLEEVAQKADDYADEVFTPRDTEEGFGEMVSRVWDETLDDPLKTTKKGIQNLRESTDRGLDWVLSMVDDKYSPLYNFIDNEGARKTMFQAVQRIRNMSGIIKAPLTIGTYRLNQATGQLERTGKSMAEIWRKVHPSMQKDAEVFMTASRELALHGRGTVKMTSAQLKKSKDAIAGLKARYGEAGYKVLKRKSLEHGEWRKRAILDPLFDSGIIDAKHYKRFMDDKQYSPFMREGELFTEDFLREIGAGTDPELIKALQVTFDQMSSGGKYVAPLKKVTKSAQDGKIIPPFESDVIRVQQIQQLAERQMARNAVGRTIDSTEKWGKKSLKFTEEANPSEFKRYLKDEKSFVTFENGKRTLRMVEDTNMVRALDSLSGKNGHWLEKIANSPGFSIVSAPTRLFRRGVVLSPDFMVRNLTRDQLTAGMMSRTGYNPLNMVRGMFTGIINPKYLDQFDSFMSDSTFQAMNRTGNKGLSPEQVIPKPGRTFGERVRGRAGGETIGPGDGTLQRIAEADRGGFLGNVGRTAKKSWEESRLELINEHPSFVRGPGQIYSHVGNALFYPFQKLAKGSEFLELATRRGAALRISEKLGRAERRAGRKALRTGKPAVVRGAGYTRLASIDKAMGGLKGYRQALFRPGKMQGFAKRYREARDTPLTFADQMDEAREITVDFQRKGYFGEVLNGVIPFSNVEFQDLSRFARGFRENPLSMLTRGFAHITLPTMYNWGKHRGDEYYHTQTEDLDKHLFFHPTSFGEGQESPVLGPMQGGDMPTGTDVGPGDFGKPAVPRIPRPVGFANSFFGTVPEQFMNWLSATHPEEVAKVEGMLYDLSPEEIEANGIKYAATHRRNTDAMRMAQMILKESTPFRFANLEFWEDMLPISPWLNIGQNKNPMSDAPIVSPSMIEGPGKLMPEDVVNTTTQPTHQAIAYFLRKAAEHPAMKATGVLGDQMAKINAPQVNHLINSYTGTVGRLLSNMESMNEAAQGLSRRLPSLFGPEYKMVPKLDVPAIRDPGSAIGLIGRGFFQRPSVGSNSQSVRDFYTIMDEVDEKMTTFKKRQRDGDKVGVGRLEKSDNGLSYQHQLIASHKKKLSALNEKWRTVRMEPGLTPSDRTQRLYQIEEEISQQALIAVDDYRQFMKELAQRENPQ